MIHQTTIIKNSIVKLLKVFFNLKIYLFNYSKKFSFRKHSYCKSNL